METEEKGGQWWSGVDKRQHTTLDSRTMLSKVKGATQCTGMKRNEYSSSKVEEWEEWWGIQRRGNLANRKIRTVGSRRSHWFLFELVTHGKFCAGGSALARRPSDFSSLKGLTSHTGTQCHFEFTLYIHTSCVICDKWQLPLVFLRIDRDYSLFCFIIASISCKMSQEENKSIMKSTIRSLMVATIFACCTISAFLQLQAFKENSSIRAMDEQTILTRSKIGKKNKIGPILFSISTNSNASQALQVRPEDGADPNNLPGRMVEKHTLQNVMPSSYHCPLASIIKHNNLTSVISLCQKQLSDLRLPPWVTKLDGILFPLAPWVPCLVERVKLEILQTSDAMLYAWGPEMWWHGRPVETFALFHPPCGMPPMNIFDLMEYTCQIGRVPLTWRCRLECPGLDGNRTLKRWSD